MRYNTGIKIFFVLLIACPHKDRVRVKDKKEGLKLCLVTEWRE